MIIYPPLKEAYLYGSQKPLKSLAELRSIIAKQGQPFGVDLSGPACDFRKDWPCDKTLYQMMGIKAHNGIDIPCLSGTKVYASTNGIITNRCDDLTAGLGVELFDKQQKCRTIYWHFKEIMVSLNQEVKRGDVLGLADNTGYSKGNHLHFALKQTDDNGNTVNHSNDFFGAIDPMPYLVWFDTMTEKEVRQLQALEGYSDESGVQYWTGKTLADYLKARLADKVKTIQATQ
jgi:murein DD-endopeptidase MepM/ murein hydrolase activator NlpD